MFMWKNSWKYLCFISCWMFSTSVGGTTVNQDDLLYKFKDFVIQYNRSYINNPVEYQYRMFTTSCSKQFLTASLTGSCEVFERIKSLATEFLNIPDEHFQNVPTDMTVKTSLQRQAILNKREKELKGKALYGINKFSDWTEEEFKGHLSKFCNDSLKTDPLPVCCEIIHYGPPPKSTWDWRKKHKVTAVKNQGNCGSCWAFASAGLVETQWAITKNMTSPLDLSVQELISCSNNAGCHGGSIDRTLKWLARNYSGGKYFLLPASEYPYEERESACKYDYIKPKTGAQIQCACCRSFKGKENILANYVRTNGSVAVGVNAVLWHDYIGGIIQHHCTDSVIDHAVVLEGFDMSGDIPYWIVRNSWGTDFGIDGYLYIKMNENICGVAEYVSYARI